MQPVPAAVTACRYTLSITSPQAKTPSTLVYLRAQPAFGVQRRHAACACRRDRLPIHLVHHIAAGKNALHAGVSAVARDDVPLLVHLQDALKDLGVWRVPNRDEHAVNRKVVLLVGFEVV